MKSGGPTSTQLWGHAPTGSLYKRQVTSPGFYPDPLGGITPWLKITPPDVTLQQTSGMVWPNIPGIFIILQANDWQKQGLHRHNFTHLQLLGASSQTSTGGFLSSSSDLLVFHYTPGLEKPRFLTLFNPFKFLKVILGFNLQMLNTKLRPTSIMKRQVQWSKIRPCGRYKSQTLFEYNFY